MQLSVIIPTRNRAKYLKQLLLSLKKQDSVTFQWEVIVINNASTDRTKQMVQSLIKKYPVPLRCIYERRPGLHNGRNRGAIEARGKILGYLDDDMILSESWLKGIRLIEQKKADAVAGRIFPLWLGAIPPWADYIYDGKVSGYWALLDLGKRRKGIKSRLVPGCNYFIKRNLVKKLNGFHPDSMPAKRLKYRGDGETGFFKKFELSGYKAMYDPVATAYHIVDKTKLSLDYICQRAFRQGISQSFMEVREMGGIKDKYRMMIKDAALKGKLFHRESVLKDKKLLNWVLKDNYF